MRSNKKYKFKIIDGVLSWKNEEMERYVPVSTEVLTRVILLYEREIRNGIRIWKRLKEDDNLITNGSSDDPLVKDLSEWMEQLYGIFENTEPFREKEKWSDHQINLN